MTSSFGRYRLHGTKTIHKKADEQNNKTNKAMPSSTATQQCRVGRRAFNSNTRVKISSAGSKNGIKAFQAVPTAKSIAIRLVLLLLWHPENATFCPVFLRHTWAERMASGCLTNPALMVRARCTSANVSPFVSTMYRWSKQAGTDMHCAYGHGGGSRA